VTFWYNFLREGLGMIGKTISHYKILEKLGGGGMGIVYKAQDLKLDRFVALKFLPPYLSTSEDEKERFIHEAKAASALQHYNICAIYEIDETSDNQLFIVMDYHEGETLKKKIETKPLKIEEAIEIALQVAEGLQKTHQKGLIHCDIKPANIFITENGIDKILDFGLAKPADQSELTKASSTLGTVYYMSPEQTKGGDVDHRSDI
jgi:serine/threonine protein kinase